MPAHPHDESGADRSRSERHSTSRSSHHGLAAALRAPLLRTLLRVPLKKVAIWGSFLGTLFLLRDYFGLVFLTFVISYIASSLVDRVAPSFSSRKVPVLLVFAAIVGGITGVGFATVPRAIRQGRAQLEKLERLSTIKDPQEYVEERLIAMTADSPILRELAERLGDPAFRKLAADYLADFGKNYVAEGLKEVLQGIGKAVVYLFAALVFSFMIVWDMPRIARGVQALEHSRLGDVWVEVAPSIASFFQLLGRAFEAQTMIAVLNTALTAVGLLALGVHGIGFLSLIVFGCSFVPIVGVFISTVPICLVALQQDGGSLGLAFAVIAMVTVVHLIEAYVLNPRIYGYHMKLHPLAVLIVLYLGQNLFGVWGLIVGVPLATYVWRYLILGQPAHTAPATAPAAAAPPDPLAGDPPQPGLQTEG